MGKLLGEEDVEVVGFFFHFPNVIAAVEII